MADKIRNRTIRTETRASESSPYKIDTKKVYSEDTLIVNIDHITKKDFFESYTFRGSDVADKNSISFKAIDWGNRIDIRWSGAEPVGLPIRDRSKAKTGKANDWLTWGFVMDEDRQYENFIKTPPAADDNCRVLILSTLPDLTNQNDPKYYPEEADMFWDILKGLFGEVFPGDYDDRLKFLIEKGIGLWHVCKIKLDESDKPIDREAIVANDLENFVNEHKELKLIAFNGKETSKLFAKHFRSFIDVKLLLLSSSRIEEQEIDLKIKIESWQTIKDFLN